jgi:hypothetical protein
MKHTSDSMDSPIRCAAPAQAGGGGVGDDQVAAAQWTWEERASSAAWRFVTGHMFACATISLDECKTAPRCYQRSYRSGLSEGGLMCVQADIVTEAAASRVGTVLKGKYRLERLLGVGGMAAVHAATHRNGSKVAVTVLHSVLSSRQDIRTRFLREGYVANAVEHPGPQA